MTRKQNSLKSEPQSFSCIGGCSSFLVLGIIAFALLSFLLHSLERILSGHGLDYVFYEVLRIKENMYIQEFVSVLIVLVIFLIWVILMMMRWLKERYIRWLRVGGRRTRKKKGPRSGEIREYSTGYRLKAKRRYKHGKLHGECREYYDNGKVKTIKEYQHGKLHGIVKEYDVTGKLFSKKVYINGKEQQP